MSRLKLGVMGSSRKENEFRLPLHPAHLGKIDPEVRACIHLEENYGFRFGFPREQIDSIVAGVADQEQLIADCDVILLPKPIAADLLAMREGQVLWGWPHCVQDEELTQIAIDRKLTVIAWEAMNHWTSSGNFSLHVFHKNNELAGYASVMQALELLGLTGRYGRKLIATVIGFGATGRGAVTALNGHGIFDVTVLTQREPVAVGSPVHSATMAHYGPDPTDPEGLVVSIESEEIPMVAFLSDHDIVVNCVLQDTDSPSMFVTNQDLKAFTHGSLVIDVSCDEAMGFEWAKPTTFSEPMFTVGDGVNYYAVDHSPSYLWDSATWEISEALSPYLDTVSAGPAAWDADPTISKAIEIRDGVVQNPKILSFQNRAPDYPHPHV